MSEFEDWLEKKNARRSRKNESKGLRRGITRKTHSKPTRRRKPGFTLEIREQANERAEGQCENPLCARNLPMVGGEHHCLPRSYYHGADRNDLWNCAHICPECHARITTPTTGEDVRLRRYFERLAWNRRTLVDPRLTEQNNLLEAALRNNSLDLIRSFQLFTK